MRSNFLYCLYIWLLWINYLFKSGDLQSYLDLNGKIEKTKSLNWFRQIVDGLKYLHENNCMHRDLKPAYESSLTFKIKLDINKNPVCK